MRRLFLLAVLTPLAFAKDPLRVIHFAGWHSQHPDLVAMANDLTRREFERSPGIGLLSETEMERLQARKDMPREVPEPPEGLAIARSIKKRTIAWARLSSLEVEFVRPFWKPFWPEREWRMQADFFVYDSLKKGLRREVLEADHSVGIGFAGFKGEDLYPASDNERFRQTQILLRDLAQQMREVIEDGGN
jgi:hypothetical protein